MTNTTKPTILSIGDIVIDDFIDIKDVRIDTDFDQKDRGFPEICFRFGDKIPYESSLQLYGVGNSPNASVTFSRLGVNSYLYTSTGVDQRGQDCLEVMHADSINTSLSRRSELSTNYHYVLRFGAERTILVHHSYFEYFVSDITIQPDWIYLSSLHEKSIAFQLELAEFVQKNSAKLVFQPGTYQLKAGIEKLAPIYKNTEIFFANKEEVSSLVSLTSDAILPLAEAIYAQGPRYVVITDGPDGLYGYDGVKLYYVPMYPDPAPPIDRTGAGDATASAISAALSKGVLFPDALLWGPINSMSVVQHIGAQEGILSEQKLLDYLSEAPSDYIVSIK